LLLICVAEPENSATPEGSTVPLAESAAPAVLAFALATHQTDQQDRQVRPGVVLVREGDLNRRQPTLVVPDSASLSVK